MLINLSDVFNTPGKVLEVKVEPELAAYDGGYGEYELEASEPIVFKFSCTDKGKAVEPKAIENQGNCTDHVKWSELRQLASKI